MFTACERFRHWTKSDHISPTLEGKGNHLIHEIEK